jgi:hypothetical protein
MAGRIRRLLRNRPIGRVRLAEIPTLAVADGVSAGASGLSPSAALARQLLAEELSGLAADACRVIGPGRLVNAETLPFACPIEPLPSAAAVLSATGALDGLVVGDALAAEDDPVSTLERIVTAPAAAAARRLLVVLPGTALLPDDAAPCPRRWLFSRVSGEAMAARVLGERTGRVAVRGNVLAAATDLLGLAADRLWPEELTADDPEYPMVVALSQPGRAAAPHA